MERVRGLWRRTSIAEPSSSAPVSDARADSVMYLQSPGGTFVDLRRFAAASPLHERKAFAGRAALKGDGRLQWERAIDLRGTAPPDAAQVRFSDDGSEMVETAALPGDDYVERWARRAPAVATNELCLALDVRPRRRALAFALELAGPRGETGFAIGEGDRFAVALGRAPGDDGALIASFFAGNSSPELERRVREYACVVGHVALCATPPPATLPPVPAAAASAPSPAPSPMPAVPAPAEWVVDASLDDSHEGARLADALPQLRQWRVAKVCECSERVPAQFALLFRSRDPAPMPRVSPSLFGAERATAHLLVVRHGETDHNVSATLQGQLDVPLNAHGQAQADAAGALTKALVARLAPPSAPAIVSSDLRRAFATACAISAAIGAPLPPRSESRLRETSLGAFEGHSWPEVEVTMKEDVRMFRSDPDYSAPGGGESVRARFARVCAAVHEEALRAVGGGVVVLVAHGGVIDDIGRLCKGTPFGMCIGLRKHNCAVAHVRFIAASSTLASMTAPEAAVAACAQLRHDVITPEAASVALGRWEIVDWGILADEEALVDPLADDKNWAGSTGAAALPKKE